MFSKASKQTLKLSPVIFDKNCSLKCQNTTSLKQGFNQGFCDAPFTLSQCFCLFLQGKMLVAVHDQSVVSMFTSLNKNVIQKWSEWSKHGFTCPQPLNKKLVKASCAKRVFTSLNIKLFDWSLSMVSHVPNLWINSRVSRKMANQMGTIRGSCIRRLHVQSWQRNCWHRLRCFVEIYLFWLPVNQIHQHLHMSQTQVRTTRSRDR